MRNRFIDITGEVYGGWTVVGPSESNERGLKTWKCICQCGNTKTISGSNLRSGHTTSCGCIRLQKLIDRNYKHGMVNATEWYTWSHLEDRCNNPNNKSYKDYGGRGIKLCDRWTKNFAAFYEDMGPKPSIYHSLDRKDNNGNYEPGNCRWATATEQNRNQRNTIRVLYNGEYITLVQLSTITGIKYSTLYYRFINSLDLIGKVRDCGRV